MAKLQLNGFLEEVGDIHFVGAARSTAKQELLIRVPAWTNSFGERQGEDEFWKVAIIGTAVDKFNLHSRHAGSKVKSEVYIRSNRYQSKKDDSIGYIVNVSLASIEFLQNNQRANLNESPRINDPNEIPAEYFEQRASEGENNDLPF